MDKWAIFEPEVGPSDRHNSSRVMFVGKPVHERWLYNCLPDPKDKSICWNRYNFLRLSKSSVQRPRKCVGSAGACLFIKWSSPRHSPKCSLGILFTPHIVCTLEQIKWHLLIHHGLFPEGLIIAFTAYKILLCLILLALSFFHPICQWAFVPCGSVYQHFSLPLLNTAPVSEVLSLGKAGGTTFTWQAGELEENINK